MPPHGPGMIGGAHSHDPEYPDDDWNLYSMLDANETRFLNITHAASGIRVFKPFVRRFEADPHIISDADSEIIVTAVFTSPCILRKFMIIGGGDPDHHPSHVKLYVNNDTLDFQNISEVLPTQEFDLQVNLNGSVEVLTAMHRFANISSLTMYFTGNHGDLESTIIQYIGLQGDHSHYRREPVHTMYEVLCNGQDIPQMEEAAGSHSHMH